MRRKTGLLALAGVFISVWLGVPSAFASSVQPSATGRPVAPMSASLHVPAAARGAASAVSPTGWRWQYPGPDGNPLYAISCPGAATCFAAGADGRILHTADGSTWLPLSQSIAIGINSLSCASTTACVAVGNYGLVLHTADGGNNWTSLTVNGSALPAIWWHYAGNFLAGVSCPTTSICFAVGYAGSILMTGDGGATWTSQASGTTRSLYAINCPSTSTCFAVGEQWTITATTDGGAHWTNTSLGGPSLTGVACSSAAACAVVGVAGDVTTTDGGAHWLPVSWPGAPPELHGVSCPSATQCFAAGANGTVYVQSGSTWGGVSAGGSGSLWGITCPSTTACFADGDSGWITATINTGVAWSRQQPAGAISDIHGLSCPDSSNCYAAALDVILVTHDGGGTWTPHSLQAADQVDGISCPTSSACFAVGWPGRIYFSGDSGFTWSPQANSLSGINQTLEGVSCSSLNACVAVGTNGNVLSTSNGTTWAAETSGISTQILWSVSCTSSSSCVAVGDNGVALTRSGGSWRVDTSNTAYNLHDVSCPIAAVCYAAGASGTVLTTANSGTSWTTLTSNYPNLYGISCRGAKTCMATGDYGTILRTSDGSNWSTTPLPTFAGMRKVAYPDPNHIWVAGLGGVILANSSQTTACTSASITSDQTSPQPIGENVTFTASAAGPGCFQPIFEFWVWSPSTGWLELQPYSTNPKLIMYFGSNAAWAAAKPNQTYTVHVWAEEQGSSAGTSGYETFGLEAWTVGSCNHASLTPNPALAPGVIHFVAGTGGAGCSESPYYQFWMWSEGTGWILKQTYSLTNTWDLDTTALAPNTYTIDVWVKDFGSPSSGGYYDTWALSSFAKGACGATTITPDAASPQSVGGTITFTAAAAGCASPQYQYWIFLGGGRGWQLLRDYSPDPTYKWQTAGLAPGTYSLVVYVRQGGSRALYDTFGLYSYSVPGCSAVSLAAGPQSPLPRLTPVAMTVSVILAPPPYPAAPACDNPQYQFWELPPGGPWKIVQDFKPTATFTWSTGSSAPGTYAWVVYVKQTGSGNAYDSYALISVTLT